ncbi:MAG: type II toxin-antitoxin system Phd/YefM family antitoxin [Gammaproteobacteria bacterium]|nr:type II toxin-antitoxin system Phd/YefM family antitoxin [Gammaproteobacteria bacterium]MYA15590.1 type II toxin-antitoxin system Phd/YefM family antitoxin [Gammaproteobacteria bacterium]MYJ74283.1 type II toxin-antitoxin system Phd/YefM family antitoxin [Gammaproteobacteria bacterium]
MDFISVRQLRTESAAVWEALTAARDLVVTSNGKPIAVLSATSAEELETSLAALRQARAQLAVSAMQQRARETGADRLTLDDINAEIEAVRSQRRR